MTTFRIPSQNFPNFKAEIAKLSRKSVKYVGKPIGVQVVGTSFETKGDCVYQIYEVELDAVKPKINGFTFVARIDHTNEAGNIIRSVPGTGVVVPNTYRDARPFCDHCRVNRLRRDTFLVCEDATGTIKQIGSTCLQDFFGHDPSKIARLAEILGYANECGLNAEEHAGLSDPRFINVKNYLTLVAACIRNYGWLSGTKAREMDVTSTATEARYQLNSGRDRIKVLPQDGELAEKALEYAQSLEGDDLSDYLHNLKVACSSPYCELRTTGIIASAIVAYQRSIKTTTFEKASEFVGQVSDKIAIDCELINSGTFETDYGTTHIYTFQDNNGNVFVWYASKSQSINKADKVKVSGSIKAHKEYKGTKQTILTRCKIAA